MNIAIFVLLLLILGNSLADVDVSYYPAMSDIDFQLGMNYENTFGSPDIACNCSDNGGTPFPCLWKNGANGFTCTGTGSSATITIFRHIAFPSSSGLIPSSLGSITSLKDITIQFSNISGALPSEIFSLSNLQRLVITDTNIDGNIPVLSSLTSLTILSLYNNKLSGIIPPSITNCPLRTLRLEGNKLNGSIDILSPLTNITQLTLQNNYLSGTLPSFLSSLSLTVLDLSNNYFTGNIPSLQVPFFSCSMMNMSLLDCKGSSICQVSCRPLCTPPAPQDTLCVNDTWIYIGDYVNPNILSLSSPLNIQGDFNINPVGVIIVGSTNTYTISVNGTVVLNGGLQIIGKSGDFFPVIIATNISGDFSNITVNEECVIPEIQRTETTFSILLIDDISCDSKAVKNNNKIKIIIGSVIGGIIFVAVISALIGLIISRKSFVKCIFQSNDENIYVK